MAALSLGLAVLSAMITPAVLISACGTLILSTSNRLGRTIDHVRDLSEAFGQLTREEAADQIAQRKRALIFEQLPQLTRRVRLLQRTLTVLYLAVDVFVASSVAIGVVEFTDDGYGWIPVLIGFVGACLLFGGSILLIIEAHLAVKTTTSEMDFLWKIGQQSAPADLIQQRKRARPAWQPRRTRRKERSE